MSASSAAAASSTATDGAPEDRAHRGRGARTAIALLLLFEVGLWLALFLGAGLFRAGPNGKSLATDFAVFSAAADALRHGDNPYDYRTLYRHERALLLPQHLQVTSNEVNVRAGNPPLFYWALEPLTRLPFRTTAMLWIAGLYAISGLGFLAALRFLEWRRAWLPTVLFLLMPQVVLGACYGNIHGVVFAAIALGLLLADRHPMLAGSVLAVAWLKPQLALPLAGLVVLFHCRRPAPLLGGWLATTGGLTVLTGLTAGWGSLADWELGVLHWSRSEGLEPNLSSLVGLYAGWLPYALRLLVALLLIATVTGFTAMTWWRTRHVRPLPFLRVAWLWFAWFLAAPFAHFPDEILLSVPFLAYLGRDAAGLGERGRVLALCLAFLSLLLFPSTLTGANFLSLIVLTIGLQAYRARVAPVYVTAIRTA